MILETLLRTTAEEDGGSGVHSPRSVAEPHTGLEVWLPGQLERRRLHPGGSVCHWSRRPGSTSFKRFQNNQFLQICLFFKYTLCLQGILLEHHEKEFGNKVEAADVLDAVKKIVSVK